MVEGLFDYQFRVILIGDSTVGKSSLLRYFTDGKFAEVSDATVGVDFFAKSLILDDGIRIKLQLWDTAGQEKFRSITKSYYRNSIGVILAYDIYDRSTFLNVPIWLMEAKRHIEPHRPVVALIGCKADLSNSIESALDRKVQTDEAQLFADQNNLLFFETSAKSGQNIELAFRSLAIEIYSKIRNREYEIEDGWDGIKTGQRKSESFNFGLIEAEPNRNCCF